MRLLTANLCMISPGGCLLYPVPLALGSAGCALALFLAVPPVHRMVLDGRHPVCWGLCAYAFCGLWRGYGTRPICLVACLLLLPWLALSWGPWSLALGCLPIYGYLALVLAPVGLLLTHLSRRLCPARFYDAQPERLELLGSYLHDYDVVCFQELTVLWGDNRHVRAALRAAAAGGLCFSATSGKWPRLPASFATSGLAVASRWPISEVRVHTFRQQAWFEWNVVARGALMVAMQQPSGQHVAVMNVHTTAGSEVLGGGLWKQAAVGNPLGLAQVSEGLESFATFSPGALLRVCCGDLNLRKGAPDFREFVSRAAGQGMADCFPDSPPTMGCLDPATGEPTETLLTQPGDIGQQSVLDHVFSNRQCVAANVEPLAAPPAPAAPGSAPAANGSRPFQQVSDHSAVAVTLGGELPGSCES